MTAALPRAASRPLAALALAVLALAGATTLLQLAVFEIHLVNNGDGFRVLDKAFVDRRLIGSGLPFAPSYRMLPIEAVPPIRLLPDSLSGLLVLAIALASKAMGLTLFHCWVLTLVYHALFLAGLWALVASLATRVARALVLLAAGAFLLCPLGIGYFASPFEEAAVFALFPLWAAALRRAEDGPRGVALAVAATMALIYAKPSLMLFALPALALLPGLRPARRWLVLGLLAAVVLGGLLRNQIRYGDPNAYNRVYNGLAYSAAGVSGWPERHFLARTEVQGDRVGAQGFAESGLPEPARPFWGTSFWPVAGTLSRERFAELAAAGRGPAYLAKLARAPSLAGAVAVEGWETARRADYRLAYLFPGPIRPPVDAGLRHLGLLLPVALAILVAAVLARERRAATLTLPLVLSPVFVVMADGYYEFEKHMMPFLATGPITLAVAADWLLRRRPGAIDSRGRRA